MNQLGPLYSANIYANLCEFTFCLSAQFQVVTFQFTKTYSNASTSKQSCCLMQDMYYVPNHLYFLLCLFLLAHILSALFISSLQFGDAFS